MKLFEIFLISLILVLILFSFNVYFLSQIKLQTQPKEKVASIQVSRMSFTEFDKQKAREFMDKNNDGSCDICGMPINTCIDSGMIQCNMDPNAEIGVLDSAHIHSDFKVYIGGMPLDFVNPDYYMKSSFIHVDDNQNKEDASGVLHMHAIGVPLSLFFESLGMMFDKNCLEFSDERHCNLKMYINGEENLELGNYIFKDLDKILITDEKGDVKEQIRSITNFAEVH